MRGHQDLDLWLWASNYFMANPSKLVLVHVLLAYSEERHVSLFGRRTWVFLACEDSHSSRVFSSGETFHPNSQSDSTLDNKLKLASLALANVKQHINTYKIHFITQMCLRVDVVLNGLSTTAWPGTWTCGPGRPRDHRFNPTRFRRWSTSRGTEDL